MRNVIFLAYLYFIQGLPYGLQSRFLPIYFRSHGMSLSDISLFKLLLTPWMCKALWAPLVDKYGTKRKWLSWSMLGLIITCIMGSVSPPDLLAQLAVVLFLFNLLTSTQDIAVDGIAIHILSHSELAYGNIAQVVGYKMGAIFGGGVLTWLSDYLRWSYLFLWIGVVYGISLAVTNMFVPSQYRQESNKSKEKQEDIGDKETQEELDERGGKLPWFIQHFIRIFQTPGTKWMAVYVLLYKLGEQGALSMVPMFLIDKGIAASQVGFWTGMVGQAVSIVGSFMGGTIISHLRWSTKNLLQVLSIVRMVPLLIQFCVVCYWSESSSSYLYVLSIVSMCAMLLVSGTVTTATFTMMMQCSQMAPQSIQATHYTNLATLEVLGKLTFSVLIGYVADSMGYQFIFVLFIILTAIIIPLTRNSPVAFDINNKNS
ncbi:hypothetical protein FSP39_024370 [Pinctada imbricata]|uniref:Major facilitator superfamily domain-containing protein 3 n=1 Tax=Pinctada imbricata TaxID=66713 RepID=A0AA88YGM3_PINIB|nr:hypothetical protein FSP39_024370 [Pinctada imbricata]